MPKQTVSFDYGDEALWKRIRCRKSVFLDTNAWIDMADEVDTTACRLRNRLGMLVASGNLFCPVSWGTLEELFLQAGESLIRSAVLMEQLSLNACYVMRREV